MSTDAKAVSEHFGFSNVAVDAARNALRRGGGGMAQFDHPELGGHGQWMPGMLMIGDMFNHTLKARVDQLFHALLDEPVANSDRDSAQDRGAESSNPSASLQYSTAPLRQDSWYPAELGYAASSGGQNEVRYAYFPETRRLAIQLHGKITIYETGDHLISGVSQGQSNNTGSMTFTSQHGVIPISSLRVVK